MGVKATLAALTLTNTELGNCMTAATESANDQMAFALAGITDTINRLTVISNYMGAGSNKTAILAQITALS